MKKWSEPIVMKLDVGSTQFGDSITTHVDDSTVWNGHKYFSFS